MDCAGKKEKSFSCQDKELRVQLPPSPTQGKAEVRNDRIRSFHVRGLL